MAAPALSCSARLGGPNTSGHDARGMAFVILAGVTIGAALPATNAHAGTWPVAPGETLVIAKYEGSSASETFDQDGGRTAVQARRDDAFSLNVERGLTRRLTFQGRAGWTRGEDGFADYAGRGPVELGLRYVVLGDDRSVVSLYAGASLTGEGRNAGYAAPGAGTADLEARVLVGRSMTFAARPAFAEVQLARLDRSGLPDETHLDLTLGIEPSSRWLLMAQAYAGQADGVASTPRWLKLELSAVRRFGDWRLQAGWRQSVAGQDSPVEGGPVLAVWRSF